MISHEQFAEWARWAWLLAADHLWQATLFAALALAASAALRGGPARLRSAVWLVALAKFALPLALFAGLGVAAGLDLSGATADDGPSRASVVWMLVEPAGTVSEAAAPLDPALGPAAHNELFCALTVVWLVGVAASLGIWWANWRRVALAVAAGRRVRHGREAEALSRAVARLGVTRDVTLVLSPGVDEPGVWRALRPVVLLPDGVAADLDDEELEAVMLHEAAHVARRDNLAGALQTALRAIFWFHPVVWLVDRMLLAERERACDEAVLEAGGGARVYAKGLLKVFRFSIGWRPAGVSCATGSHLGRRIEQIMVNSNVRNATMWHRVVIASVITVMAGASMTAAAYNGGQDGKKVTRDVVVMRAEQGSGMTASRQALLDTANAAPTERYVNVEATPDAPVAITDAQIKKVPAEAIAASMSLGPERRVFVDRKVDKKIEGDVERELELSGEPAERIHVRKFPEADADGNARVLLLTITNVSGQAVTDYQFGNAVTEGENQNTMRFFFNKQLEPGESYTFVLPLGGPVFDDESGLRVLGVKSADGTTWGDIATKDHMIFVRRLRGAEGEL